MIFSFLTKCTWCVSSDRTNDDGSIGRWDPNLIEKLPNFAYEKEKPEGFLYRLRRRHLVIRNIKPMCSDQRIGGV